MKKAESLAFPRTRLSIPVATSMATPRPTLAFIGHAGAVLASPDEEVSGALRGRRLAPARGRRGRPGQASARAPGAAGPNVGFVGRLRHCRNHRARRQL